VKLLSLDPESCLQKVSMQVLPAPSESVILVEMKSEDNSSEGETTLFLFAGILTGVLIRCTID
jgi:splicing factor 3B subunit 3